LFFDVEHKSLAEKDLFETFIQLNKQCLVVFISNINVIWMKYSNPTQNNQESINCEKF